MAHRRKKKRSHGSQTRVSEKIEKLSREGVPDGHGQAAGMAYSMERSGRLGRHGRYHRVGKRRRRRGRRS
jgi:hypothetical protein